MRDNIVKPFLGNWREVICAFKPPLDLRETSGNFLNFLTSVRKCKAHPCSASIISSINQKVKATSEWKGFAVFFTNPPARNLKDMDPKH